MLELPSDTEDYLVENAPVRSHEFQGMTIEGYSRAAMQSYWRIPELKIGFDFGLQPWSFMTTPNWAVSHTHMDHIAALAVYVSRRRLMKMPSPTIYLPEDSVNDVHAMLKCFQKLDRGRLPCNLVGMCDQMEVELSREHILKSFRTEHTIESLGYTLYSTKKKLKPEYADLSNNEIRDLRLSGTDVTNEVRTPVVCYLGDTNPGCFDREPDLFQSKILIVEMTFLAKSHKREKIHKYGHLHLDDFIDHADRFQNELIIACHFSTRYPDEQIRRLAEKRLPEVLRDRLLLWI